MDPNTHAGPNHKRKEPPVLKQVAEGVLIHESEFIQSNSVVVQGRALADQVLGELGHGGPYRFGAALTGRLAPAHESA
jgi:hypothetical protein